MNPKRPQKNAQKSFKRLIWAYTKHFLPTFRVFRDFFEIFFTLKGLGGVPIFWAKGV
jgi:hypothetical protein